MRVCKSKKDDVRAIVDLDAPIVPTTCMVGNGLAMCSAIKLH